MINIGAYCRVSTDDQGERKTIDQQREEFQRWMQRNPGIEVKFYDDDGVSGTIPLAQRPSGRRLLADLQAGKVTRVVIWNISRLGRELVGLINAIDQIETAVGNANGNVESISEGVFSTKDPGKILNTAVAIGMASADLAKIRQNTSSGSRRVAKIQTKDGSPWLGGPHNFGYTAEQHADRHYYLTPAEKPIPGCKLSEADVVRQMFDWTDDGETTVTIARKLQKMRIPPCGEIRPGKRKTKLAAIWMAHRVRDILKNPIYKGKHTYRVPADPYRNLPAEEIARNVPALVPEDQWERVQNKIKRNGILAMNTPKYPYLLRGLVHCGHRLPNGETCGHTYSGITTVLVSGQTQYYRCLAMYAYESMGKERKDRCPSRQIRADALEKVVRDDIAAFLARPGEVIRELERQQQTETEEKRTVKEIKHLEDLLAHQSEERNNVMRMHRRGIYTDEQCESQLREIKQETAEHQKELAELRQRAADAESAARDLRTARALLDAKAKALRDAEDSKTPAKRSFTLWREIIEALVSGITVETDANGCINATVTYRFEPHFQRFVGRSGKEFMEDRPATALTEHQASPAENGSPRMPLTVGDSARRSPRSATPRTSSCACTAAW